jgi:hypothetical protein
VPVLLAGPQRRELPELPVIAEPLDEAPDLRVVRDTVLDHGGAHERAAIEVAHEARLDVGLELAPVEIGDAPARALRQLVIPFVQHRSTA